MIVLRLLFSILAYACSLSNVEGVPIVLSEGYNITIKDNRINFHILNNENGAVLQGELGVTLTESLKSPQPCDDNRENCLQFGPYIKLAVVKDDQCYHINWTSVINSTLQDCFDYQQDNWYGGPESIKQYWPFNNMTYREYSYVTKEDQNQAVAEPYWLTSTGFYIHVRNTVPLFIDSNNYNTNTFCIIAKQVYPYLPREGTKLEYNICAYSDVRKAHTNAIKHTLRRPTGIPDTRMVQHPIWSTWVRFKFNVNETAVKAFAKDIIDYGFNNSQIEIDDDWETCYGSGRFNKTQFPNMPKLGEDLKNMGFRVTVWKHPFVNTNCELFQTLKDKGYLVKNHHGNVVSSWWDGEGGVIDFTNADAAKWFVNHHLAMLADNNIDSLKFDAGESSWLPQLPQLNADINDQPNAFTASYVRAVSQFGNMVEVRVGHLTQDLPIFVRMLDKDSKWTFENGLSTLLTTLFQMNLNGYTFVLPDMVGGNAYAQDVVTKELFIRWLQANTFMPVIQFSAAPWDFDDETVEISKKFTALHYTYAAIIIQVMEECVRTGAPVNMPLWHFAPTDKQTYTIWSEYMLGDKILVAPVVEQGAVTRNIYLPKGKWRDEADPKHTEYEGPQWLQDYPAPLDVLPYFSLVVKE